MGIQTEYRHLEQRPDKRSQELFVRGVGVRASTIWHDRYVSRRSPAQIAQDRDIPLEAVYDALAYCQEHWETICREKDSESERLRQRGFFDQPCPDRS